MFLNHNLNQPISKLIISLHVKVTFIIVIIFCLTGLAYGANKSDLNEASPNAVIKSVSVKGTLKQIQGTVLVNHGKGYSMAQLDMELKEGDRVLTMDGARAVIVQADGCIVKLTDNVVFTLKLPSACQSGTKSVKKIGPYYARAIGAEAVTDVVPSDIEPSEPEPDEIQNQQQPADEAVAEETTSSADAGEEKAPEEVVEAEGTSIFDKYSTTQIVVTGVAVGLGLAVIAGSGGGGGGNGSVSGQ